MKIIGLTGNSGAGKSTMCEILKDKYDVEIIDADMVAKELTCYKSNYLNSIIKEFGKEIIDENGNLNRKKLANIIYNNTIKREKLNKITFVYVVEEIRKKIERVDKSKTVVIDAPLLFESGLDKICDLKIGIIAKDSTKLERICKRDNIDEQTAKKRIDIQLENEYLLEHSDIIIENNSSIYELEQKIIKLEIL